MFVHSFRKYSLRVEHVCSAMLKKYLWYCMKNSVLRWILEIQYKSLTWILNLLGRDVKNIKASLNKISKYQKGKWTFNLQNIQLVCILEWFRKKYSTCKNFIWWIVSIWWIVILAIFNFIWESISMHRGTSVDH